MDPSLLYTISTFEAGFFDFVVAVAVIGVAFTLVRKADATAGYVLGGAMGIRFLASCCTRAFGQVQDQMSMGDASVMIGGGLAIIRPFFDLIVWGAVLFALVQLAKKVPNQG